MRRSRLLSAAAALLVIPLLQVLPASSVGAAPSDDSPAASGGGNRPEKNLKPGGKPVDVPAKYTPKAQAQSKAAAAAAATPAVGSVRQWLRLDPFNGKLFTKDYTPGGGGQ